MTKIERKIATFLKDNCVCILFWAVTVLGLGIRYYCRNHVSVDARLFLLPWYDEFRYRGAAALRDQIGDYNILYQFLIYLFTFVPIRPLYAIKAFSVIFDYALAIIIALIVDFSPVRKGIQRLNSMAFVFAYTAVILSPLVFFNSACWAQCDSIYAFFVFAAFYALLRKKHILMFIMLGAAFSFKFQTILVIPFFLIVYILEMDFSIFGFILVPIVLYISAIPGLVMGRDILEPIRIYYRQTKNNCGVWMNSSSFWNVIVSYWPGEKIDFFEYKMTATLFSIGLLGVIAIVLIRRQEKLDRNRMIELLHILVYTVVFFLPGMHDRYGYIYELTAIMLVFINKKFLLPAVGILLISGFSYGYILFGLEYNFVVTSVLNTGLYCWYAYHLLFTKEKAKEIETN